jgi:hypothetical protein
MHSAILWRGHSTINQSEQTDSQKTDATTFEDSAMRLGWHSGNALESIREAGGWNFASSIRGPDTFCWFSRHFHANARILHTNKHSTVAVTVIACFSVSKTIQRCNTNSGGGERERDRRQFKTRSVPTLATLYCWLIVNSRPVRGGGPSVATKQAVCWRLSLAARSAMSDYRLDDRATAVRSLAEAQAFSSSLCVQTSSESHPASYPMCTRGPFPQG